jgi:hypothetical protein
MPSPFKRRKTMKLERTITVKREMVQNLMSVFKRVEEERCTFHQAILYREDALKHLPTNTPQWLRQYLSGYFDHWYNSVMQDKVRFMYRVKGKLYGIDSDLDDYYENNGITPMELNAEHTEYGYFWNDTEAPFSVSERKSL